MHPCLISFEGIDFSGKSLQARLLFEHLVDGGFPAVFLREPGSTIISEKIRQILLDRNNEQMAPEAELLLYSAARSQMVSQQVIPLLREGKIVICDRYFDSTTAYQGYGREIDLDFVKKLNKFAVKNTIPDLTFLIDLGPEEAVKRKLSQGESFDRLEREAVAFHRRVRSGYLKIADANKKRFVVVQGDRTVDEIQQEIKDVAMRRVRQLVR